MRVDMEFELPLLTSIPRAVSGIPFIFAQTKIEKALKIKRGIEDFEVRTTHISKPGTVHRWSNDIATAKQGNVSAPIAIAPTHPLDGTDISYTEVANAVKDLDATADEGILKYVASSMPINDAMIKMADGGLDGIEKINISQSADSSQHVKANKQGFEAMSIADIFAPAAIESGLITKDLTFSLRSALVAHCIGPDGSYCWRDFSDGTVLSTIADAMVGQRPDMDIAVPLCYVAPIQHNEDRYKRRGCDWWLQRNGALAAF